MIFLCWRRRAEVFSWMCVGMGQRSVVLVVRGYSFFACAVRRDTATHILMGKWGKWGTRASAFRSRTHRRHRAREGTHEQPSQERKASHQHVQMTGEADGRNRTREQGTVSGVARLEGLCFSRSRELFSSRSRKVFFSVPIIQYQSFSRIEEAGARQEPLC